MQYKLDNPHHMLVGSKYKIIEPVYDDYNEGLKAEENTIEVIKKTKNGFIFNDIKNNFTYEIEYKYLMECIIIKI